MLIFYLKGKDSISFYRGRRKIDESELKNARFEKRILVVGKDLLNYRVKKFPQTRNKKELHSLVYSEIFSEYGKENFVFEFYTIDVESNYQIVVYYFYFTEEIGQIKERYKPNYIVPEFSLISNIEGSVLLHLYIDNRFLIFAIDKKRIYGFVSVKNLQDINYHIFMNSLKRYELRFEKYLFVNIAEKDIGDLDSQVMSNYIKVDYPFWIDQIDNRILRIYRVRRRVNLDVEFIIYSVLAFFIGLSLYKFYLYYENKRVLEELDKTYKRLISMKKDVKIEDKKLYLLEDINNNMKGKLEKINDPIYILSKIYSIIDNKTTIRGFNYNHEIFEVFFYTEEPSKIIKEMNKIPCFRNVRLSNMINRDKDNRYNLNLKVEPRRCLILEK